ncbi:Tetraspanin/Peripherin [Thamnocephalis sphaerospora]|uniref:Tetraspanin/Peripherin n=1 Tax=Thamnocephalis sphaerospora TaxID=78915 RepID=A0A4V1IWH4_9FUNG|nr:Tetraspanin/Peripherin [Thamnocephalis sphaerospora]|eukprot:RKP07569.1 Tetraspanin/Peripherin [Thamnocephalis sphaerospora]
MAIQKSIRMMFLGMNTIFFLAGAASVGVGAYFYTDSSAGSARRNAVVTADDIMSLIAIGSIVLFTALVGYFAYLQPVTRKPLMITFCFAVIGIVVVQVIMGILVWYKTLTMYDGFGSHWRAWDEELRDNFQRLNEHAPCCGFANPTDFAAPSAVCSASTPSTIPGCQATVYTYADSYLRNIYTCIFIFVFIGIFDFFTAVMVVQAASDEERYEKISQKIMVKPGEMRMQFL